ncbi:MAG: rhomboid family intramembrane serine protease [Solirubrobacterales bacterium]|nr:rhomboid family intramembrane serine protease [Solirubrobacterales bacterium]
MTQAPVTLIAGTHADTLVPMLGASGAIVAVLGAYFMLFPRSRSPRSWSDPAWVFLGLWFVPARRGQLRLARGQRQWRRGRVLRARGRLRVRCAGWGAAGRQRQS